MSGPVRLLVVLAVLGLVGVSAPVAADSGPTVVDSNVTESTTWSEDHYRVVTNVTVEPGQTLSVSPGTTVEFAEGIALSVAGAFEVNGTSARPVRLTTSKPVAAPGTWGGIRTVGSDRVTVTLRNASVTDATDGLGLRNPDSTVQLQNVSFQSLSGDGVSMTRGGTLTVRSSHFESITGDGISAARTDILPVERVSGLSVVDSSFESVGSGIDLDAKRLAGLSVRANRFVDVDGPAVSLAADRVSSTRIDSNTMAGVGTGIALEAWTLGSVTVTDTAISNATTGIDVLAERNVHALTLTENRIRGGRSGITVTHDPYRDGYYSAALDISGNTVTDQRRDGITLRAQLFSDSSIAVRNNTIRENGGTGALLAVGAFQAARIGNNTFGGNGGDGLRMTARHVRDTTVRRNLARENGGTGLLIRARQAMEGVQVTDNDLFDNAREGLALTSGTAADGNLTVAANRIAANAYGLALSGPSRTAVTNNSIVFNTVGFGQVRPRSDSAPGVGVLVTGNVSDVELAGNDIYGHRIGLSVDASGTVHAAGNYWGSQSGPYHRSINPEGTGNAVETRSGWVELAASPDRHGPAYERPTAELSIDPVPATVGTQVELSGAGAHDADGTVRTYRFTVNGTPTITDSPTLVEPAERVGSTPVTLQVEDDMGIESTVVHGTIRVTEPTTTTSITTSRPTQSPTTAAPPDDDGFGPIGLLGGLLGGGLYLLAVLLGARGLWQTLNGEFLTVRGRRLHVLAGAGIGLWLLVSVPGPSVFRAVAIVGATVWAGLTGLAYLVVRLR